MKTAGRALCQVGACDKLQPLRMGMQSSLDWAFEDVRL
jgi:hypothetical protein